jgi:hypothetical protein
VNHVDPVHAHGVARLRKEYLERHPGGGNFKAFLERFDNLREAVHGHHKPVRFYGLTFGHHSRSTLGEVTDTGDTGDTGDVQDIVNDLPASLPQDDAGRLDLLHQAGLATDASSLQDALKELELPFMFAGREQWVENLQRSDGAGDPDPKLQNVAMESIVHDKNALNLLLGRAHDAVVNGTSLADDFSYWQTLVPDWAPGVRDQLEAQGIPFSLELLSSPEINLTDPSKPLFPADAQPVSLAQLGVHQAGERAFLRSLSAQELMTQIWPLYYQYYHRPAGAPVPAGMEAGLTFGSPVTGSDGKLVRSPIMDTEVYKRWAAYGQPGTDGGGWITDEVYGIRWNPLTGEVKTFGSSDGSGPFAGKRRLLQQILGGKASAANFPSTSYSEGILSLLGSRVAAAAAANDPSIYFAGPLAEYANMPDDVLARFKAL